MNNKKSLLQNDNKKSNKMYSSIMQGLQNAIDDARSKNDKIDFDNLMFNDVLLSTEDSHVDIIPNDPGSDSKD